MIATLVRMDVKGRRITARSRTETVPALVQTMLVTHLVAVRLTRYGGTLAPGVHTFATPCLECRIFPSDGFGSLLVFLLFFGFFFECLMEHTHGLLLFLRRGNVIFIFHVIFGL